MEYVKRLNDPRLTAKFQKICGVFKDGAGQTCANCKPLERNNNNSDIDRKISKCLKCRGGAKQTTTSRALLHLFTFASSLGNEIFYLVFYPYCVWNIDSVLIRRTAIVWCICMYLGQATKDYLLWPRPASPPVVRLETEFLQESSMPSTHAMSATAIPFMLAYLVLSRYEMSPYLVLPVAVVWCGMVCLSRLYLGVHSVLDVLCGVLFSTLIMLIMYPYLEDFDWYQQTHPFAPFVVMTTAIALCTICYPPSKDGQNAKGDAVQIVGVLAGVSVGSWLNFHFGFTSRGNDLLPYSIAIPTLRVLALSVLRFFVGVIIVGALKVMLKKITVKVFSKLFGLKSPDANNPSVNTAYKFSVYSMLGFCIVFLVPFIHCMFGLERESYFKEVM